ncbi:hypothetical protein ACFV0T_37515 [Streptomyces sp. NPDC059582]|uniref:hypothetical protein n=1 Tax=Streptomyces sp. NPDC059582 TaxID=3346875 RepID=UPI0036BCA944
MTHPGNPPRDYARHLIQEPPPEDADELREDLFGPTQPLVALTAACVARNDVTALRRLSADVTPLHRLLGDDLATRRLPPALEARGDPFRPGEGTAVNAARSLGSLGLALVDPDSAPHALDAALRRIRAVGIAAPTAAPSHSWDLVQIAAGDAELARCLTTLAALPEPGASDEDGHSHDARLIAALTLQHLAGRTPRRRRPQRVRVLLSRGSEGRQATLAACLQPGAPAGLVPDPQRMSQFSADTRFLTSLERAWSHAASGRIDAAVLWWLENEEGPVRHVADESFGAAFATVLDEVRRMTPRTSALRAVNRLTDDVAVVGRVDSIGNLRSVGGYREKLESAKKITRVVVPVVDEEEAGKHAPRALRIEPAATWAEAARRARRKDIRTVVRDVLSLLLVGALAAGAYTLFGLRQERDRSQERQNTARSRQLVEEAGGLERTDPGLSRQLLLMAYATSPTAQARGALLRSLTLPGSFTHDLRTQGQPPKLAFQPSGQLLAVGGQGAVALQDIQSGKPVAGLEEAAIGDIGALAFSPDGRILAVGGGFGDYGATISPGQIQLWDVADPRHARRVATLASRDSVTALAFNPKGSLLATGSVSGPMQLWDIARPEHPELRTTFARSADSSSVSFAPNGRQLAWHTAGQVSIWDLDGRRLATMKSSKNSLNAVAYAPSGTLLATLDQEKRQITVWDVADGRHPRSLTAIPDSEGFVRFSAGDRYLVTTHNNAVALRRLVRLDDGRLVYDPNFLVSLDRSAGSGSVDGYGMDVTGDGHAVAASTIDGTVRIWDISVPEQPGALTVATDPDPLRAQAGGGGAAFSPDSTRMAVECGGSTICLWDVRDPRRPKQVGVLPDDPLGTPFNPTFSPDGKVLFTTSQQNYVAIWDVSHLNAPTLVQKFEPGDPFSYRFSPDGTLLVAAEPTEGTVSSRQNVLALWDLTDPMRPKRVATLPGVSDTYSLAETAISPDNRVVASLDFAKGLLSLWNIADPRKPVRLPGRKTKPSDATQLAFSADSKWVLTGGNGAGRIWKVNDPGNSSGSAYLAGSLPRGARLTISAAGNLMVAEGEDFVAHIWSVEDIHRPTDLAVIHTVTSNNSGWKFSPDGRFLVAGSLEHAVSFWALDVADIKDRLCTRIGARITRNQWQQYLPERDYAPPCG